MTHSLTFDNTKGSWRISVLSLNGFKVPYSLLEQILRMVLFYICKGFAWVKWCNAFLQMYFSHYINLTKNKTVIMVKFSQN